MTLMTRFDALVASAQACRVCPDKDGRRRVLGPANGPVTPRVLFVAEAPGRRGAERTGIPLTGDQTGIIFGRLLTSAGIVREEVFISNAVLCNPRDGNKNRAPTRSELAACRHHLATLIAILDPPVVATLGRVALRQLHAISPVPETTYGVAVPWNGTILMPLIHPSPRATIHRSLSQQHEDWRALGITVRTMTGPPSSPA